MTIFWKKPLSAALLALLLATTVSAQEKIEIYNLKGFGETTLADFQKITGIKPVYDDGKLSAKRDNDLVVQASHLLERIAHKYDFIKLEKSLLPNWKNLDPLLIKRLESSDPGNQYLAPYLWGTHGIGYNPSMLKAALGIDKIDSWNVLFEPENIEKLSQCGVALLDSPDHMIPAMLAYLGLDPNSTDLDDYKKAEEKFIQISKHVTYFYSKGYISDLAKGNICIAAGFSGDVMQAAERASKAGNGIEVHYAIPKDGAALLFEVMTIPATKTANPEAAHAFINYLLDPRVIAKISDSLGYANPNLAAREFMDKRLAENSELYPSQAVLDKTYVLAERPKNIIRAMTRSWTRIKSSAITASAQEKLNIYNENGHIDETTLADFQKATGIKPVYDIFSSGFDSDETLSLADLRDDLTVVPTSRFGGRQIKAGAFQKLDKSLLPNWKNLDPLLLKRLESIGPGNQYLVPYLWETYGIGYNPKEVKAALGIDQIDSWNVLFEPENIKKLSQCGIAHYDPEYMMPAMLAYLGFDPNSTHLDDYQKAEEQFSQISKHVTYFLASSSHITDLADGNICIAAGFSGEMMQAADRARKAGNGVEVHFAIPKEGAALGFDVMAIPLDTPNTKAAHAFINYLLDPEVIAKISDYVGYANPNLAAREFMDKRLVENPWLYPPQAVLDKTYVLVERPQNITHEMTHSWKRINFRYRR